MFILDFLFQGAFSMQYTIGVVKSFTLVTAVTTQGELNVVLKMKK
jgi:hypothetical protein